VSASPPESDAPRDLAYYEAVPYLLVVESVECVAEAPSAVEAMEKLEQARLRVLRQLWDHGMPIPVPRPPLRGAVTG